MRARQGTPGDAIAVDILVTAEILAGFQFFGRHHLAAVIAARIVPDERLAQALIHADVQIGHDKDRRLQAVGEIEGRGRMFEAFERILRQQQHMLGVAMRGIGAGNQVRLLGAGGHTGRWAAALDIDDGDRYFSKVGQADEFSHQRNARS